MSVDISTLAIEVRSDGVLVASNRLKELTDKGGAAEKSVNSLSSASDRLAGYLKAAAAALVTLKLADYIKEATLLAARVETLGVVMRVVGNNAGYTGAQMEGFLAQVKKMGITTQESMSSLIKMASAQMDLAKASQLARVAQDAAVIGGVNSSEAFGRMIHGIRSGETEILRTIGINVQFEQGYKSLAATLGKTSNELTATEKVASRMNQVLDFGKNIAGAYEASMGTAGKQIQSMSRYTEELKLKIGETFTPALTFAISEITRALKEMDGTLANNKGTVATFGESFKQTFIAVAAEVQRVSMLIDLAGGTLTAFASRALKIAEVVTRFMTIGQFGDWLKNKSAEMAKYNAELATRYAEGEANLQRLANLSVPGATPTKDYAKEQERAALAASAAEKEKKAQEARAAAARVAAEDTEKWKMEAAGLRAEMKSLNPALSEYDRSVLSLNNKYDELLKKYPKHRTELQGLRADHLAAARAAEDFKNALDVEKNMTAAWESEQKLRTERATTAAHLGVQLAEQQGLREEALRLTFQMENAALAEHGVYEGQVKVLKDKVDALRMAAEQERAAKELAAIQQDNKGLATSLISDPYEQEKQAILDRYEMEKAAQEKALKAAEKDAARRAAIQKNLALLEQKYIKDTASVDSDAQRAKLQATSFYTGMAGDLFSQLATLQDESSRKGFEAAKDYSLAGAVVSTAAAIMNALATVQPYPAAVAAAAMAAATGAIQIAKIESTSFGGGSGSVSAPSGSFTGGGGSTSGGSIGKPFKSLQQSQDADVMERLADSMENASVEMRRVADGLVSFQDVLSNEQGKRNIEGAPNRYMATSNESSWLHKLGGTIMDTLGFESTKFIREGDWGGLFKQLRDFSLSAGGGLLGNALWGQGNKWRTTGGGFALGIEGGELEGMNYIDRKKSGGLLKSSKKKTEYSALDEGFAYWLENTLGDVGYSTNLAANVLGTTANIGSVNIPTAKIKTSGRSTEDIQKDLEKWLQNVGNAFAKTVDGLEAFTAPGEEAFAALMRLSISLQTVNDNFNLIGKTLLDSTLAGGNSASKLADLFGGLEQFSESMESYFTSMFTDAEQQAALQRQAQLQVNAAFKEMNVSIPQTKESFRNLVDSLDVTTESGAQLFAALMEVAPAFAEMIDITEKLAKATRDFNADLDLRLMRLNGEETSLYELRIQQQEEWAKAVEDGMDLQRLRMVQDAEWARAVADVTGQVSDSVQDMVAAAQSAVTDMIDAQIAIGKSKINIMTGPLANLSPEAAYMQAKAAYDAVAGKDDLASLQKLPELAQALLNASRGYNASGAGYQSDLASVLAEMDRALGITGGVTETQTQITLLENIRTAIETGATDTVNQLTALLGPNSTLAGLIGTWNEATEAKLLMDKQVAAEETYYREQAKYTEAVKAIGADFAAGKITFADYTSQATSLYSPVQTAWGAATDLGVTGLTSTGISTPPVRDDSRLLTELKTKIYTDLQGEFMGVYPPFEGQWFDRRGNDVEATTAYIASLYGQESAFAQLDRLISYAHTYHIAGYAKGGFYPGGSSIMGEIGPELVDSAPGYVYRADETKALFEMAKRGIADNYSAELVSEIRELRREVAELRGTAEKGNRIAEAVGTELAEIGTEGNRQRGQVVKGERMRGAA